MLGSKEIDRSNNSDIYDTYKDLYLREKECEEKLLTASQRVNGTGRFKTSRWHSTDSDNAGKCH